MQTATLDEQRASASGAPVQEFSVRTTYNNLGMVAHAVKCQRQAGGMAQDAAWMLGDKAPAAQRHRPSQSGDPFIACFESLQGLSDVVRSDPALAWTQVREQFHRKTWSLERACIAAGPIEDLLVIHGPRFIGQLESHVAREVEFVGMLHAIWIGGMRPDVWLRLQRLLGTP